MKADHVFNKWKGREFINLPARVLILTILSIMVTDILVAYIVKNLAPLPLFEELLIDSFLLIIILLPIIYYFEFRPLAKSIADLNREKEKTMRSEEKFSKAFMNSSDSVNINRMSDGMFISVNKGFTRILGFTEEDVTGKTSLELNIWADPLSRAKLVKELQQNGIVSDFEANFRRKDGKIVNGLMSASIIEIDGVPHLLNETKDITQNKLISKAFEFEQFLVNALMNNIPDHIYFKDRESKFIRNNKAHAMSFGLSDPDQLTGKSDFDFFTREAAQRAYEDEQMIIKTGQPVFKEEKLTRKDQSVAWFFAMKMPLRDNKGNIIGTFGISRDITLRKRTELENEVIYEIIQGIVTTSNLDELLKLIHHSLGKVVYAENFFVALYNNEIGLFSFPYFVDKFDSTPLPTSMGKSCTAYVFRTGKPFLFTKEAFDHLKEQNEITLVGSPSPSWVGIPLQTPSRIIGVLVLQHYEKENTYSKNDLNFLISIGSQIAIAIERKMSDAALRESEKDLNESQKIAGLGSYKLDFKTGIWTSSHILDSIFGIDDKYDKSVDGWLALIHPSWQESMKEYLSKDIIELHKKFNKEYKIIRHNDKNETWVHGRGELIFDTNNNLHYMVGTILDITQQKLAEEELVKSEILNRTLIKHLPQRIFVKDPDSKYILCNDIYSRDLGINPKDIVGKDDFEFFSRELAEKYQTDDKRVISEGVQKEFEEKYSISNQERWTHVIKVPYRDANDQIVGVLGIFEDITDRKLREQEIIFKNDLLQAINEEKDKFFSIIAHDLRGPLSAFVAATRILTEEIQTMNIEEIKEITLSMKSSATNIYTLLENLLEWSRLRRGGLDFVPEKLNLKEKVNDCIDVLSESARKKKIQINVLVPGELEIYADNHMLDTVVRNLMSNAIKFTQVGGKVTVEAYCRVNHIVEVKVSDSGIGMTPELKDKLFILSEKTSRPGTEGESSTGLGLLLCKEFIEKNGGKIWVDSIENQGSTFYFSLPY
jgi:PAS domain S-box-containing protein